MLSPIELAIKPLKMSKEKRVDYLLKHRRELEEILGAHKESP
mgnify:CR=1 FL=1